MPLKRAYYIVNGITTYRLAAAPALLIMALLGEMELFKWFLLVSFSSDMIDGYMARKFKVTSVLGAKLDSIADDLTIIVALIALVFSHPAFISENIFMFSLPFVLFLVQMLIALIKYGKITSFHTYAAKLSALVQGLFLLSAFFLKEPHYTLFISAFVITTVDLIEEIIIVLMLKKWKANVKGLWWVIKSKNPGKPE